MNRAGAQLNSKTLHRMAQQHQIQNPLGLGRSYIGSVLIRRALSQRPRSHSSTR